MCSVRQSPIPSAPKPIAFSTCSGVSAFVRMSSVPGFVSPAHQGRVICIALAFLRLKGLGDKDLDDLGAALLALAIPLPVVRWRSRSRARRENATSSRMRFRPDTT